MLIWLQQLLTAEEVRRIAAILTQPGERFQDGKPTAGNLYVGLKENQELDFSAPEKTELDKIVMSALARNRTLDAAARPKQMTRPIYSRYRDGMHYGSHLDAAVMGKAERMRIDLSITIFLSDPASYDGGELHIDTEYGPRDIKLPPGDAILYPTVHYHEVKPVTRGERLAAVLWLQSLVKDVHQRNLLYELAQVADALNRDKPGAAETRQLLKVHMNLLRLWAEN